MGFGGGAPSWVYINQANKAKQAEASASCEREGLRVNYEKKISKYKEIVKKLMSKENLSEKDKKFLVKEKVGWEV